MQRLRPFRRAGSMRSVASVPGPHRTHEVFNQSDIFYGNAYRGDVALVAAVTHHLSAPLLAASSAHLDATGTWAGSSATAQLARTANSSGPVLRQFDRNGHRVDRVEFVPAYHELCAYGIEQSQTPSWAWQGKPGGHVVRAALSMLAYQAESGVCCPLTMTFAGVPALEAGGLARWAALARTPVYDPRDVPTEEKAGAMLGMSMTEKTGGSDVRSNTTTAAPLPGSSDSGAYSLRGHKWFTSAPHLDAFLTLAYGTGPTGAPDRTLSCFLVPRWLPGGARNAGFRIMRLKEKLGDRSNASSEVEYDGAVGFLAGERGAGVPAILEMVVHTRLDCALGSAALMRQAARAAVRYCAERRAFGTLLVAAPAMRAVLAELCVESEAAVWMSMLLARAFEDGRTNAVDVRAASFRRLSTAVAKYWVCKRAPLVVGEALECIGGNGYAAEWDFERWYRQAPLNAIWEGSSNVQALDVLRTCSKDLSALRVFFETLRVTRGVHLALDTFTDRAEALAKDVTTMTDSPSAALFARHLVEQLALALQGHALALGVQGGRSDGLLSVLNLWCALRLPSLGVVSGETASAPWAASFCLGAASPSQLRVAAGTSAHDGRAILDAVLERELAAIRGAAG